ncbi:MAG: protein-(glutamine-N5) methyltransferase, release factor-specific [Pelagibacteraceae bacterium TMED237]|nr:MAG: protein-(glutamine-N5) methyltransferase, release factor-specific [Pelagibacteraceae bacterium TMED237]|tara:strand:+ start:4444 stop:5274 length:831 start_codon:yes stop_codon:yes gene_type:complete
MNDIVKSSFLKLKQKKIPYPELDLRILLKHASYSKKDIILSNLNIEDIDLHYFNLLILKRLNLEPISKIIKKKYFWKSEFYVNSDVLDPRPETELIIEEVLNNINDKNKKITILDIGTGSGCLAISLAKELKYSKITAIDKSKKALAVAKKNIKLHKINKQIELKLSSIEDIKSKYDIIICNPPYIDENDYKNIQFEIRKFEPKIALLGGKDGLKFYRLFAKYIEKNMKRNSIFIFEIGHNQLNPCIKIFEKTNLILKKISKDIQKIDRTLTFFKI